MSRPISVVEEFPQAPLVDRAGLMLDESPVFHQYEGWTPSGTEGGDGGGNRLRPGEFLRDANDRWWRVYDIGGGKLRLAPVDESGKLLAPKSQWSSPSGAYENELGQLVQTDIQGNITTSRTIPWSDWAGGAGGGTSAPQWRPGELGLEQQALQHQIEQDKAELAWAQKQFGLAQAAEDRRAMEYAQLQMEMLEKRLDNDNRQLLYSQIGAATQTVFQAQEAERGRQQEMAGKDIFRFTGTLRGRGTTGQTPVDVFKQQGAAFANQPLPQFSINDPIPQLEAGLRGLEKMAITGTPQGLIPGMAQGGTIEMEKGGSGAFSMKPATEQTVLVGDGAGIIPGVTEALTLGTNERGVFSLKVTPIVGGAQGGMSIPGLDFGGFPDLLESLRRTRGLTGWMAKPGQGGTTFGVSDVTSPWQASTLGAFQRPPGSLLQAPGKPVFVVDETGKARPFASADIFRQSGFDFSDVQRVDPRQLNRFERGPDIRDEPFALPLPNYEGAYGALGQPLNVQRGLLELAAVNPSFSRQDAINLANTIGFLPAPHKIARDFPLLDPAEQQGLISLYELAGFPAGSFQKAIGAATPTGRFGRPQRIGFTGTRL